VSTNSFEAMELKSKQYSKKCNTFKIIQLLRQFFETTDFDYIITIEDVKITDSFSILTTRVILQALVT
jgi:hypothetical protein